jgi:hypothetical protein
MRVPVPVSMVKVGIVRMTMHKRRMPMPMGMRLAGWIAQDVFVLVVRVVPMPVLVLHRFVRMLMLVLLGQMHPEAESHQAAGDDKLHR